VCVHQCIACRPWPLQEPRHGCRHLRDLLHDQKRSDLLYKEHVSEHGTLIADFSRQRVTDETLKLLFDLANKVQLSASGFPLLCFARPNSNIQAMAVILICVHRTKHNESITLFFVGGHARQDRQDV
jgi:hypothetical protein